jgi:hypothetical protein
MTTTAQKTPTTTASGALGDGMAKETHLVLKVGLVVELLEVAFLGY